MMNKMKEEVGWETEHRTPHSLNMETFHFVKFIYGHPGKEAQMHVSLDSRTTYFESVNPSDS